ncbi:MAG: hypothetical protein KBC22_02275 [Candidatus Pacebacteria bacterium]|nr:hypothetical protein [Candidatus Paceibacterota bacterium]
MDNKPQNQNDNQNDMNRRDVSAMSQGVAIQHNSAFSANVFYNLAKRAERITTALHMVSNFIPKEDALHNDIRRYGLRTIKNLYRCINCDPFDQQLFLEEALVNIEYTITALSIASATGMVSTMNRDILEKALHGIGVKIHQQLQIALRHEHDISNDPTASIDKNTLLDFLQETANFDQLAGEDFQETLRKAMDIKKTSKTPVNDMPIMRTEVAKNIKTTSSNESKDRQQKIQDIIADKGQATIKDIATRITNCSEKTLQRDLLKLIKDNVIEKEGDKRWSLYRIKK